MKAWRSVVVMMALMVSQPLLALRCDSWVVEPGDTKQEVYDACGDPDSIDSHYEQRGYNNHAEFDQYGNSPDYRRGRGFNYGQDNFRVVEVLVEEWVYDFGRRRLRQHLRFENGRLKK